MSGSRFDEAQAPIGVFDSGVGGLTVLREMRRRLPAESMIYLGDTARVPYGTKSPDSILRYATRAADHLTSHGIKLLAVACNTASALALDGLRARLAPLPVVGVVEPGARAAVKDRPGSRHLVLATESTVMHGAYGRTIRELDPQAQVEELACSVLVSLAEEGWTHGPAVDAVLETYLAPVFRRGPIERPHTVVLGCTHFPTLAEAIRTRIGPEPTIVDSARTTAEAVEVALSAEGRLSEDGPPGKLRLLATDGADRFARVGARFLGEEFRADDVEIVDL